MPGVRAALAIPAIATVALYGAVLFSAAGTADAAASTPQATASPQLAAASANAEVTLYWGLYTSPFLCSLAGRGLEGTYQSTEAGVYYIVGYKCVEDPDGGYSLLLIGEPAVCPSVSTQPAKVEQPDTSGSPSSPSARRSASCNPRSSACNVGFALGADERLGDPGLVMRKKRAPTGYSAGRRP